MLKQTPSQTVGPFFHSGLVRRGENVLVDEATQGERIDITGQVLDGAGEPVPDALVEIWQADAHGHFQHPADAQRDQADDHFRGFGRSDTTDEGRFWFRTVKPGRVADRAGQPQAPHVDVRVFARGTLIQAVTRLYFPDEPANEADAVLTAIADPSRRQTLIALREDTGEVPTYRFDIHLQGDRETVFLEP